MSRHIRARGFTLVELMVTLVVLAILTVVAVVSYSKYTRKAKMMEAIDFLTNIKMKQETYFGTYGQYVDTASSPATFSSSDFYPSSIAGGNKPWSISCPDDQSSYPGWCALGARPTDDEVNYQYVTVGWQNNDPDPPSDYIEFPERRWWYAEAKGDLDSNGVFSTFRFSSEQKDVFYWHEAE